MPSTRQANTARALAVQEVQRLLDSADSLKRLPQLREDVLSKQLVGARRGLGLHAVEVSCMGQPSMCSAQMTDCRPVDPAAAPPAEHPGICLLSAPAPQANKAQLAAAVASQVEAAKLGLDQLTRAHQVGARAKAQAGWGRRV